jgi:hypothetical protein
MKLLLEVISQNRIFGATRNWRRQVGPSGQRARERESVGERELPLKGGVRLSGGAGARACGLAGPSWAG